MPMSIPITVGVSAGAVVLFFFLAKKHKKKYLIGGFDGLFPP